MIIQITLGVLVTVLLALCVVVWALLAAVDEEELNQRGDRYWSDDND